MTRPRPPAGALLVLVPLLALSGGTAALQGQSVEPDAVAEPGSAPPDGGGWLRAILGRSPDRNRFIPGLWAMHPFEPQFPELDPTRGFGGMVGHWFGATFVNSYEKRTFIVGVERNWAELRRGPFRTGTGYRVGLITGYDERLIGIARHTPVLPFGGVLVWGQVGPVGVDVYYVYRAISLETSIVF